MKIVLHMYPSCSPRGPGHDGDLDGTGAVPAAIKTTYLDRLGALATGASALRPAFHQRISRMCSVTAGGPAQGKQPCGRRSSRAFTPIARSAFGARLASRHPSLAKGREEPSGSGLTRATGGTLA